MASTMSLRQVFGRALDKVSQSPAVCDPAPAGSIDFGDFHIDTVHRDATLRGRNLDLSPEEFDVLVFLAGHPQSMITPHTMLATKTSRVRQTEFLRTMLSLRAKLDAVADPGTHYLRTESWVVYRFDSTPSIPYAESSLGSKSARVPI